ncbi:MAG: recombinase family protein [Acidobacteria bacterium]|nr:recombinase family protein [Acidobacteriota bacterium]
MSRLEKDALSRKFDVLIVWKLDRLGRSLQHLVTLLSDLDRRAWRSSPSGTVST